MSTYSEKLRDPRWQKKRLEILERDKWTCQGCGETSKELQVHHTIYESGKKPWEHDSDGLKTLCVDCHLKATQAVKTFREAIAWISPHEAGVVASYLCLAVNHIRSASDDAPLAHSVLKLSAKLLNDISIVRLAVSAADIEAELADALEREIFAASYP